jgi:hypothetical protein
MQQLRIAIDPALESRHGPEVHWAWRTLLAGMGYAWRQVDPGEPECDIAYMAGEQGGPRARLRIQARPDLWAEGAGLRLAALGTNGSDFVFMGRSLPDGSFAFADERATCARDVVLDFFWVVAGLEEAHWARGAHGYADLTGTAWLDAHTLLRAPASLVASRLQEALGRLGCGAPHPRWPAGKRAAVAASHDVDYPEVVRWLEPLRILRRLGRRGTRVALEVLAGRRSHWSFDQWQRLEGSLGMRSAFYFVARKGSLIEYARGTPDSFYDIGQPHFRALLRGLVEAGWEVGLHGSYRACESLERFMAEKARLEEATGAPVLGHRHHYWHMGPGDPEPVLLMHEAAGFAYDASLTHDRYPGWRRGLNWPFFPFHRSQRRELRTLQLPTAWMDAQLLPFDGSPAPHVEPSLRGLVDVVAAHGGLFLCDMHDYVFDAQLYPGWSATYRDLHAGLVSRGDFWVARPADIARHWADRHAAIVSASVGLA